MPHNHGTEHAGTDIEAAVYAIVENAACVEVDNAKHVGCGYAHNWCRNTRPKSRFTGDSQTLCT